MLGHIVGMRVRASSLIEVITALVILSLLFGLAITIYLNVQRAGLSSAKTYYYMMLDEAYYNVKKPEDLADKEYLFEEVVIYQTVQQHPESAELKVIHLEARSTEGKVLAIRKHLKYVPLEN